MDVFPPAPEASVPMVQHDPSRQPVHKQTHAPFKNSLFPEKSEKYEDLFPAHGRCGDDLHSLYQGPAASTRPSIPPTGPSSFNFESFLASEFDLSKVHAIKHRLWLAGRPIPPRSLHTQITLGREVVVSEKLEHHLVWGRGKMYLKPLGKFLFCRKFWDDEMACRDEHCHGGRQKRDGSGAVVGGWDETGGDHSERNKMMLLETQKEVANKMRDNKEDAPGSKPLCKRCEARQAALGLLYSYVALIQRESELETAKEKGLLPNRIEWSAWRRFAHEFLSPDLDPNSRHRYHPVHHHIAVRFIYGELRLNRLNMISLFTDPLSLGFVPMWTSYGAFVVNNSSWIIGGTAWIVVVLSAMQVALGTELGSEDKNPPLQRASYWFSVVSMLLPLAAFALLFLYLLAFLVWNLVRTMNYERERSKALKRVWSDLHKSKDKGKRGKGSVGDEEAGLTQ